MLRSFGLGGGKETPHIGHAEVCGLIVALQQSAKLIRRQAQTWRMFRLFLRQAEGVIAPRQTVIDRGAEHKNHRRRPKRHHGKPRPSLECQLGVECGQQGCRPARRMQGAQKHHSSDRAPHRDAN